MKAFSAITLTDGAGPDLKQRAIAKDFLAGEICPSAVITDSTAIRVVITALSFVNPTTKAFSPSRIGDALTFAKLAATDLEAFWTALEPLRRQMPESRTVMEMAPLLNRAA